MRIGVLGAGLMGGKLGTLFARAGHKVIFSYARTRKKLDSLAREAGKNARAGTPREAAENADVVILAVHWSRVVSAFGTIPSEVLFGVFEARRRRAGRPSLLLCGDDEPAKEIVAQLIRDLGFEPEDAGPLRMARYFEPFALLVAQLAYEMPGGEELAYRFERFSSPAPSSRTARRTSPRH